MALAAATTTPVPQPRFHGKAVEVSAVSSSERIRFDEDFHYTIVQGLLKIRAAYSLKAGEYVPEFRDAHGVYYRGPGDCASTGREGFAPAAYYEGGIYVPDDSSRAPYIYYYFNKDHLKLDGGAIVNTILRHDDGELFAWPAIKDQPSMEFVRSRIVTNVPGVSPATTTTPASP
ncbi:hypothetical protein [Lysobacter fragariae]